MLASIATTIINCTMHTSFACFDIRPLANTVTYQTETVGAGAPLFSADETRPHQYVMGQMPFERSHRHVRQQRKNAIGAFFSKCGTAAAGHRPSPAARCSMSALNSTAGCKMAFALVCTLWRSGRPLFPPCEIPCAPPARPPLASGCEHAPGCGSPLAPCLRTQPPSRDA